MMKSKLIRGVLVCALFAVAGTAAAQVVEVKDPWARATAPGQKAGGVFMQLKSPGGGALVAAESPAANVVEIHEMAMEGNVMRMRAIPKLDLPAGQTVELKPGGYHVMLIDLKAPLKKGDMVPVKLKVQGKDGKPAEIEVKAEVRDMGAGASGPAKH
jgi:hypothetical protein